MSKKCDICGRGPSSGNTVKSRGRAKKDGGVGIKQTGRSNRQFKANIQRVWAVVDGTKKKINACTKCIKNGHVKKPAR
jgi:large subunit ribosomal protein L28